MIKDGNLVVDLGAHSVMLGESTLALTSREYDLLVFLMRRPRQASGPATQRSPRPLEVVVVA